MGLAASWPNRSGKLTGTTGGKFILYCPDSAIANPHITLPILKRRFKCPMFFSHPKTPYALNGAASGHKWKVKKTMHNLFFWQIPVYKKHLTNPLTFPVLGPPYCLIRPKQRKIPNHRPHAQKCGFHTCVLVLKSIRSLFRLLFCHCCCPPCFYIVADDVVAVLVVGPSLSAAWPLLILVVLLALLRLLVVLVALVDLTVSVVLALLALLGYWCCWSWWCG